MVRNDIINDFILVKHHVNYSFIFIKITLSKWFIKALLMNW